MTKEDDTFNDIEKQSNLGKQILREIGQQYAPPPQRAWVGLTDEEVEQLCLAVGTEPIEVRLIEAKLKEKNG